MNELLMGHGKSFKEVESHPNEFGDVYLGEVPASELITGDALASLVGVINGISQNTNTNWLKIYK